MSHEVAVDSRVLELWVGGSEKFCPRSRFYMGIGQSGAEEDVRRRMSIPAVVDSDPMLRGFRHGAYS